MSETSAQPDSPRRLTGQVALVTGAARRVGRTIALMLADEGADVAVHYHTSRDAAEQTCRELCQRGVRAEPLQANLGDPLAADFLVGQTIEKLGQLQVCVANASVFSKTPFGAISATEWDRILNLNLRSVFLLCQSAARQVQISGGGSIVTLGDWAGLRPYEDYVPYCVSKAGVIALTKALAKTLAPKVRVNCVCPGPVMPPEDFSAEEIEAVRRVVPLQRIGSPHDIAEAIRYLVCATDFATGVILNVDGGRLIA